MPHLTDVQVDWRSQPVGPAPATGTGDPSLTIGHVVAVGSGKGGVGKSTIAASIAYGLRHRGQRVGIMDADVYGPSIPHMLGVSDPPRVVNNRYQPPIVDGMPIMSMGFLVPPEQAVIWRGPMLHKAVSDFLFRVEWGSLDVLVVDLPPGTGDIVLSLSQQMPVSGGVIVCTPQEVALLDARKALAMLNTVKIPCLGVVENMSYFVDPRTGSRTDIFGHGGAQRWSEQAGVPFLGAVPLDIDLRIHGDNGQVRQNFAEDCPSRGALLAIADRLLAQLPQRSALAGPAIEVVE
jgi:ATP-binding protein involved in chromosome partitioning